MTKLQLLLNHNTLDKYAHGNMLEYEMKMGIQLTRKNSWWKTDSDYWGGKGRQTKIVSMEILSIFSD